MPESSPVIVVTGANGLVGCRVCAALVERGAHVRALVRRAGSAADLLGVEERVGDFADPEVAADVVTDATAVVTTVHPMGASRETQHQVGVEGTTLLARAARDAGVERVVHISTTAVYDRSPGRGDADESSPLVGDDGNAYEVTKRDADAALAGIDGLSTVLVRPPSILGPGDTSVWNALRPARMREDEAERHANPDLSFPWIHLDDLAAFTADVAVGRIPTGTDPARGLVEGACTAVNLVAGTATARDYHETVGRALGFEPVWDQGPTWTGRVVADRAHGWGWSPTVDLDDALDELARGLRG